MLLLLAPLGRTALAAPSLDERVRAVDRAAAQRLLPLARAAVQAKQRDQGLALMARVLALDGENADARRALGYERGADGGWNRSKEPQGGSPPPEDAEAAAVAARIDADALAAETWRAREIVALARRAASPDAARPHLLALLDRLPRMAEVHEALGHPRVGDRFVRPELLGIAQDGPARAAAWRALSAPRLEARVVQPSEGEGSLEIPGRGSWPWLEVGERRVTGTFARPSMAWCARRTECAHDLLRDLFGEYVRRWDPLSACVLDVPAYEAYARAHITEPDVLARVLRCTAWVEHDPLVMRVQVIEGALDLYTHMVGAYTAQRIASPRTRRPDGSLVLQGEAYAWFQEGVGYLLTLELWDSAETSLFSWRESNGKQGFARPRPYPGTRTTLLTWVGEALLSGHGAPLRDVLTKSINGLDFLSGMEAWTFVRFLALFDPEAFRRLPAALASQAEGPQASRVDRALGASYGKGLEVLEALWRAWLLEVA